jgi:ADP-heptose:LPS heptosyltransferase
MGIWRSSVLPPSPPEAVSRVRSRGAAASLLVYTDGEVIGDGMNKLPLVHGLRAAWPEARITWATGGRTVYRGPLAPLVAGALDEVLEGVEAEVCLPRALFRAPLAGRRWDVLIDTQTRLRRSLAVRGIRHGLYLGRAASWRLSARRPPRAATAGGPRSVIEELRLLFALAGRPVNLSPLPPLAPEWLATAQELLPDGPRHVGLVPGAGGREKCWPLEYWLALGRLLAERGEVPVCFPGPDEADIARVLREQLPAARLPEQELLERGGTLRGPRLVMALATRLACAVANDCGGGHMLAAGGVPLLTLFTDRRRAAKFAPHAPVHDALCADDFGGRMQDIPLQAVLCALDALPARSSTVSCGVTRC